MILTASNDWWIVARVAEVEVTCLQVDKSQE